MHFTYEDGARIDKLSLSQGDVLQRTPAVEKMLEEVHPHYLKSDYRFFIVLTQSCDLVRRDAKGCSARYISIAAVRSCDFSFELEFERHARDARELRLRFSEAAVREKLAMFCERLLNNNEPRYFFLNREPSAGLDEDCCAFLQLSVAVKAALHYDTLLAARIIGLRESFQHKLGYLVGQMYSRIGTEDWVPNTLDRGEFDKLVNSRIGDDFALWLPREVYRRVKKQLETVADESLDEESLERAISEAKKYPQNIAESVLSAIREEAQKDGLDLQRATALSLRVRSRSEFRALAKSS